MNLSISAINLKKNLFWLSSLSELGTRNALSNCEHFNFTENAAPLKKEFSSSEAYGLIPTALLFKLITLEDLPIARPDQNVNPCPS